MDWFRGPVLKLVLLVAANVFYTAPVTVLLLVIWYRAAAVGGTDWRAIEIVALTNVIAVLFITHANETVFLIKEREDDGRRCILCRTGSEIVPVELDHVADCFSQDKLTHVATTGGQMLVTDFPLARLEADCVPDPFFRVNRYYLVRIDAVLGYSLGGKGRIDLRLKPLALSLVRVSQERAAAFRSWIQGNGRAR